MGAVETFVRLFRGRADAYGSWEGGCIRRPLTVDHFDRHLHSHQTRDWIGVYNVIDTRCSWGCVDMDVPDLRTIVRVRMALADAHIPSWIEQTTRGFHLWVFPAAELVEAATMRRALTAACLAVNYSPKEVFPKQDRATGTSLGNYVRLPLNGGHAVPRAIPCRRFIHPNSSLLDMDMQRAATADLVTLAAQAPARPQPVDIPVDLQRGLDVQWEIEGIGGTAYRLWRDGPRFGHDRSTTLAHLAHRLAEQDVDIGTAVAIVASADERWGKFHERGDVAIHYITKIVGQSYANEEPA